MIRKTSCAFTGHRPSKLPWGYDETAEGCVRLKAALAAQIAALVDGGVTDFLSGMAQGLDKGLQAIGRGYANPLKYFM